MLSPKVSVCIDVHNYDAFLPDAIESVLQQDFGDFEIIIVDDASQDRSFEIARSYAARDQRVIARQNSGNLGMVKNRNACLRLAQGEYVKFLHADDFLCRNDALEKLVSILDGNAGISLVACAMQVLDSSAKKSRRWSFFEEGKPVTGTTVITRCLRERRNLVGSPSATMFRRDRGLRGFDENLFHSADWEMWLHLLEQGSFGYLAEPLVTYRKHDNQQTEKDKQTLTQAEDHLNILKRYLERPYVRLSKLCKSYLRHRAIADYAKRSRQLGRPEGKALVAASGAFAFHALSPVFFAYRQGLQLRRGWRPKIRPAAPEKFSPGLNVAGFFQGEYGIGASSRAFCQVIQHSALPAVYINIPSRDQRNLDRTYDRFSETNPHSVNLMTFSFDYARRFSRDQGSRFFKDRYNIALWYWELEKFPPRWHHCFDFYDEIWTTTTFCQKSLAEVSPIPVTRIGYPFFEENPPVSESRDFGFKPDSFLFLFSFDFHSVVQRKNPDALIAAFKKAFGAGKDDVCLILKTINAHRHVEQAESLRRATQGLNVIWISEHLDGLGMKQLFATADCYVSLHRSEGLGLGMAQAMSLGKPVIATGYSGNMDFTTPTNSLLVRYQLAELEQDHGVYEKGNFWAEPDTDQAAEHMRWVFENREESRQLGERARADLHQTMSPTTALAHMRRRLGEIDARFKSL